MSGKEDTEYSRRSKDGYNIRNPIPTIQHYREEKEQRRQDAGPGAEDDGEPEPSKKQQAVDKYKEIRYGEKPDYSEGGANQPYQSTNKNQPDEVADTPNEVADTPNEPEPGTQEEESPSRDDNEAQEPDQQSAVTEDTSQTTNEPDPKQRRKNIKKSNRDGAAREVTDPVTHLPVTIHDFTAQDLKRAPENEPPAGSTHRSATNIDGKTKAKEELHDETSESQGSRERMQRLFPPPEFEDSKRLLASIYQRILTIGLGGVMGVVLLVFFLERTFGLSGWLGSSFLLLVGASSGAAVIWGLREYTENKVKDVWERKIWEAERNQGKELAKGQTPESTQWLNALFASVWPMVNPDLFTSLADTLEDVMQASLPKLVRMVSVEDIGQGSEALRILGIQWLPTGAAAKSVTSDGKIKSDSDPKESDRSVPGQGEVKSSANEGKHSPDEQYASKEDRRNQNEEDQNVAEGMEAEEGDFVNVEIAFAYRARANSGGLRDRSKNAHLYLAFYLPSGIKFPVWVELEGLIGVVRLRLQLTPDPPFFALCTLSFMGQPKVDLSCVPLTKKGLNIMDLPVISNFVQSAVDAAMAEYVAPKSLTLDLKDMLVGDDFKKDTSARGVLVVRVKRAFDFKEGDPGMGVLKKGSADGYVTVGWAKFGKPVWSTRVILEDMEPYWEETAFILVTPEELNVDERLRLQLWDSDRSTADDDLGRIEVDLKKLMRDDRSNGRMWDREDGFKALKAGEGMPGQLEWSVGYYSKTRILDSQLAENTDDPDIKNIQQLKQKVSEESERKLREASKDESDEIEQQKQQDFKTRQDQLLISSPPPKSYPSGILSVQIHQITGLSLEAINKNQRSGSSDSDSPETESGDDLPSAYCTVILNHQAVFKTRTKPKNAKPFFNAGCERFVRDWRTTDLHIAVRDARVHEDDALLGILHLPLGEILKKRSQVSEMFPLSGGVGYGKVRVSLLFRAVQLQAPKELLGWEYGTLELQPSATADLPSDLRNCRLKFRTGLGKAHMYPESSQAGTWKTKKDRPLRLAVRKRYSTALVLEWRSASKLLDKTPAFSVLWLKDVPDEEETTLTLPIWKGDLKRAEKSALPECGEKIGSINVSLIFWRGLGAYHSGVAGKDRNVGGTMEVLQMNEDVLGEKGGEESGSGVDLNAVSDSSSSSSDEGGDSDDELEESGKRGPLEQAMDYKKHAKSLHRRNRGLMQWKAPRTINWMKHKVEHGQEHVESLFQHHERDTGIETEV